MEDYGLTVKNDSGSIIISSYYKVLVFSERGTFRIQSQYTDKPGYGIVAFKTPVRSSEPPEIFVRRVSGTTPNLNVFMTMLGSTGNWTGFKITSGAGGSVLQNHSMEFVCCKFSDVKSNDAFGMQLWDESGRPVFTSSDRIVKFDKMTKAWSKSQGTNLDTYSSGMTVAADDFVSITSIDRGINWHILAGEYVSLALVSGNSRVLNILVQKNADGVSNWYYQGVRSTRFTIPVCKFPTDRYYNEQ